MYEKEFWKKYHRLTIIWDWKNKYKVLCKCDCWKEKEIKLASIKLWTSKSCWCLQRDVAKDMATKYDEKITKQLHSIYKSMRTRCNNKNCKAYKYYWGRWIRCLWNCFEDFYKDMAPSYINWLTIERVDVNWNYCKDNCKWISMSEQTKNKRNVRRFFYRWKYYNIPELSELSGIWVETIRRRINKWWDLKDILFIKNKYKWN